MKKDIEWLISEIDQRLEAHKETNPYNTGVATGMRSSLFLINQLDDPEVLSWEWIEENSALGQFATSEVINFDKFVKADKLQNLLVPKQEEIDQAYKDGYEKGKEHATKKQTEETETVAGVLVDYLIASAKLKLALSMEVEEPEQ